jgi:hypothetical protein|tara:strand:+ start:395 stop:754 length:360 start_codon:yes stop_codon:yes gene_type:complete
MKQETLQEQRKNRIGRNDFKRNMRANRQNNRAILCVAAAAVLFLFSATLSADEGYTSVDIDPMTSPRAESWKKKCIRYFQFKEPRIIVYKDLAPTVWCMIESRKILRGEIPFNYKKDTR